MGKCGGSGCNMRREDPLVLLLSNPSQLRGRGGISPCKMPMPEISVPSTSTNARSVHITCNRLWNDQLVGR